MAITMSSATVETDQRDSLISSNVEKNVTGSEFKGLNYNDGNGDFISAVYSGAGVNLGPSKLAGVTPQFAQNVTNEIENYKNNINTILDKLQDRNSQVAFKGEGVKEALNNFVTEVRNVAKSYTDKLTVAENQIINSVAAAYKQQDTDLSSDMSGSTAALDSQKANIAQ